MPRRKGFFEKHSLTIASAFIVLLWIVLYSRSSSNTHLGSFFGNAIADWTGVVVTVLATKFLYEQGSAESRPVPQRAFLSPLRNWLHEHSLTVFLVITGIGWILLYAYLDSESKWGQVVGNIVSEWTQIFGLVVMTKRLIEPGSKESKRHG